MKHKALKHQLRSLGLGWLQGIKHALDYFDESPTAPVRHPNTFASLSLMTRKCQAACLWWFSFPPNVVVDLKLFKSDRGTDRGVNKINQEPADRLKTLPCLLSPYREDR